jgi:RNA polymerase sigma-32 factor
MATSLPMLGGEDDLTRYFVTIKQFPMLAPGEEFSLARKWRENADKEAAHKLVTSHLRFAAKIAMGYRGYGLPVADVIAEANIGLMEAVKRFDPEKGFKLATYAMWWIRASIQEYILKSWSMVRIGTTASQKKLFFGLRKAKSKISALSDGDLTAEQVETIATGMDVAQKEVVDMNRRLGGDISLNAPLREESEGERQDLLLDESASQESRLADHEEKNYRHDALDRAIAVLNARERRIFNARRLRDEPITLESLASEYGVSRERIRQIEVAALRKVTEAVKANVALALVPGARSIRRLPPMDTAFLRIDGPRPAAASSFASAMH